MKFLHLSDLHIGKRVHEISMLEDQKYILNQILTAVEQERPDGVLIAGDVYDKSVPSAEAVQLFDDFLVKLAAKNTQTFIISGNHDSPERMAFAARLIAPCGIHIAPVYNGEVQPITLFDDHGAVHLYMLPFVKPAHVRKFYTEAKIETYTDAMRTAIGAMGVNVAERNVLITHQFVTGAERSESEETSVGGADNVDASVFDAFDYVALGHIHGPQNCGARIRYCGTPLKYSFSEAKHKKSITVVELGAKGECSLRELPLVPMHDMHEITGDYAQIMQKSYYENTSYPSDYMRITLTDEEDVPDAMVKLRTVYKNLMCIRYDNARTRQNVQITGAKDVENKSPIQLFSDFYKEQNNTELSAEQTELVQTLMERVWGEEL